MAGVVLNLTSPAGGQGNLSPSYINFCKMGTGYGPNPNNINQYGCPVTNPAGAELAANAWRESIVTPSSYTGDWVLKWSGTGGFRVVTGGGITVTAGSSFVTSTSGGAIVVEGSNPRVQFNPINGGSWFGQFVSSATVSYSNMKGPALVRAGDESAYDSGELINPDFLSQIKAINPTAIRMVNWGGVSDIENNNSMPYTNYNSMSSPLDYFTWGGSYAYPISSHVATISGTNTYTCSAAPNTAATVTAGETIWGFVTNANTSSTCTLNINSRGSKPIKHFNTASLSVGEITSNVGVFVYDPISDSYLYTGSGGATLALGLGVPLPVMVKLCNDAGCGLWYNFTALTTDSEITNVVSYIRDNLNSNLICYLEWGNEIWGGVPMPADLVGHWGAITGNAGGAGQLAYQYRNMMGLATSAWSPRSSTQLKGVLAWQATGLNTDVEADLYEGKNSAPMTSKGWDTVPNRPIDFASILSYATYYQGPSTPAFQGSYQGTTGGVQAGLYTAADNYALGTSTAIASSFSFVDSDLRSGTIIDANNQGTLIDFASRLSYPVGATTYAGVYTTWNAEANKYGKQVLCYEGGLQMAPPSIGTLNSLGIATSYSSKVNNLFVGYKNSATCKQLALDQLNQFMTQSTSVAPAWYDFAGDGSQWSTHPGDLYSTPFQTYQALIAFGAQTLPSTSGGFSWIGNF